MENFPANRNLNFAYAWLFVATWLCGCSSVEERYMKQALNIMERHSINRKSIPWKDFRGKVMARAKGDRTLDDSHNTLKYAIEMLGDRHSFFATPEQREPYFGSGAQLPAIDHRVIDGTIAYVLVPSFVGNDSLCALFSSQLQAVVRAYDRQHISDWIVDLRANQGGNMWPMMLGIAPLLKEGVHGFFVDPDSVYLSWRYLNGAVFEGEKKYQQIKDPYKLQSSNARIAILIGNRTGSSGEAIAVCFKGLGNTRFFGDHTAGAVTSNNVFALKDGTELYLTVSRFCDRNKHIYNRFIQPDELIPDEASVIDVAVRWLKP